MLVKTLLAEKSRELITINPQTSIDEAMDIMIKNKIGCLLVIDKDETLTGIVSDKDIFKAIHQAKGEYHSLKAEDVMTSAVIVGMPNDELASIAWIMQKNWVRHIPIVDEGNLVGLVSQRDILKYEINARETENRYLQQFMDGIHIRDRSADV